jgi:predicted ATPase
MTRAGDPRRIGQHTRPATREAIDRPWFGRAAEARLLAELLDALDEDGEGTVLQVAGEPGIGKSRLLRELLASAVGRGLIVLSGRAAELEAELPFGVFADAMDDWLQGLPPEHRRMLAGEVVSPLAIVLPAYEGLASAQPPELQQERYRAYRAVRNLLGTIAADTPVVVILDDVQWADPGSLELLSYLLAHPPRGPVLLTLGFRPAQLPARLATALAAAERDHDARRVHLEPLGPLAARQLLLTDVPEAVFERLYRESGGNPFFLLQLARGAQGAAPTLATPGDTATVPEPVRAALATELSSLDRKSVV